MKDKKHTPDLMGEVLGSRKSAEKPITENMQPELISIRIPAAWRARLKAHFKSQGQDFSNGLRLAISQYMEREGLK